MRGVCGRGSHDGRCWAKPAGRAAAQGGGSLRGSGWAGRSAVPGNGSSEARAVLALGLGLVWGGLFCCWAPPACGGSPGSGGASLGGSVPPGLFPSPVSLAGEFPSPFGSGGATLAGEVSQPAEHAAYTDRRGGR